MFKSNIVRLECYERDRQTQRYRRVQREREWGNGELELESGPGDLIKMQILI